jgi:hypothetical protein
VPRTALGGVERGSAWRAARCTTETIRVDAARGCDGRAPSALERSATRDSAAIPAAYGAPKAWCGRAWRCKRIPPSMRAVKQSTSNMSVHWFSAAVSRRAPDTNDHDGHFRRARASPNPHARRDSKQTTIYSRPDQSIHYSFADTHLESLDLPRTNTPRSIERTQKIQ